MLPLTQSTITLIGIAFVVLFMVMLAIVAAAIIMRTIGIVTME